MGAVGAALPGFFHHSHHENTALPFGSTEPSCSETRSRALVVITELLIALHEGWAVKVMMSFVSSGSITVAWALGTGKTHLKVMVKAFCVMVVAEDLPLSDFLHINGSEKAPFSRFPLARLQSSAELHPSVIPGGFSSPWDGSNDGCLSLWLHGSSVQSLLCFRVGCAGHWFPIGKPFSRVQSCFSY